MSYTIYDEVRDSNDDSDLEEEKLSVVDLEFVRMYRKERDAKENAEIRAEEAERERDYFKQASRTAEHRGIVGCVLLALFVALCISCIVWQLGLLH